MSLNRRDLFGAAGGFALGGIPMAMAQSGAETAPPRSVSARETGAVGDGRADDTAALQAALDRAFAPDGAGFVTIPPGFYRVSRSLRIAPSGNVTRPCGIIANGARLLSEIRDGSPVLEVVSRSTFRFLLLQGVDILGNGAEGHGISLECEERGHYLYNFCLRDLVVQNCGGDGCRLMGNVFEGQIFNCYFRKNRENGATFGHGKRAGILSAIRVMCCIFGDNGVNGANMIQGCYDVSYHGCYFLLNRQHGLVAANGCTLLSSCGFENNHEGAPDYARGGYGLKLQNFATLVACTSYSRFKQKGLLDAYIVSRLVMVGCTGSGGDAAKQAGLARLRGGGKAQAVVISCSGEVAGEGGFEPLEIGGPSGGMRFGSGWQSRNLAQLGDYRLWVDETGSLRMKRGEPTADRDGTRIGSA